MPMLDKQHAPMDLQPRLRAIAPIPLAAGPVHESRKKRSRASKPKVRTGCKTCKIRHVKCDEAKPICQACQRARIVCDGYSLLAVGRNRPSSAPPSGIFTTQQVPYVDFFRHALVVDFTGYSSSDFWSRVVLCAAMTDDCVRHAVLAIAALSAAISDSIRPTSTPRSKPSALAPWTARSVISSKHRLALRYYVESLSLFRTRIETGLATRSPRSVLIMSLLLITFELLQGNMEGVDRLMTTSIHLLRPSLTQHHRHDVGGKHAEDDVTDIEHMLPFLSIMGGWTPFLPMQRTNLALWDVSPGAGPSEVLSCTANVVQIQTEWSRFFSRACAFTSQAFTTIMQTHPPSVPESLVAQQQAYLAHLSEWKTMLSTALLRTSNTSIKAQNSIQLMQLHCLVATVGISCCLDTTDTAWDAYDVDFETIIDGVLSLAKSTFTFIPNTKTENMNMYQANFTLSMGILSTLGPPIAKCRDHNIRMRALEIARRMPWREGAWDAQAELYGKLGGVLLEERARIRKFKKVVDGDWVSPSSSSTDIGPEDRWTWIEGTWDVNSQASGKKMVGVYARSLPGQHGELVIQELELGLDAWVDICGEVGCAVDHAEGLEWLG